MSHFKFKVHQIQLGLGCAQTLLGAYRAPPDSSGI